MPSSPPARRPRRRVRIGTLWIDAVDLPEALAEIEALVDSGTGGAVYTPNVDHVVQAESNERFRHAYEQASLSLADGAPLLWVARLLGCPLPGKVSGSDILVPLMELAARRGWRVYVLGGAPGVAEAAARLLAERLGVSVVGADSPTVGPDGSELGGSSVPRIRAAKADLLLVALGAPKQELWIHQADGALGPTVALGIGGTLDFLVGRLRRAPRWISKAGLEWLFRLMQEPRRLWRRYLVEDARFPLIVLATWWLPRSERISERGLPSDDPC